MSKLPKRFGCPFPIKVNETRALKISAQKSTALYSVFSKEKSPCLEDAVVQKPQEEDRNQHKTKRIVMAQRIINPLCLYSDIYLVQILWTWAYE